MNRPGPPGVVLARGHCWRSADPPGPGRCAGLGPGQDRVGRRQGFAAKENHRYLRRGDHA